LIYTIGHSTLAIHDFLALLKEHDIEVLVDVRRWPMSRRYPQFNRDNLEEVLESEGMRYVWLGESLGGYRREGLGERSPNGGWRNEGFRNYADYALTGGFEAGLGELLRMAATGKTVIMCAEKHYWRCHRRIISDYIVSRGQRVTHIVERGKTEEHRLTDFASVVNGSVTYPSRGHRDVV
jgi:uncharacterized protein (DUF488 family)